jgi:predicted DCC family thiol-disulfide oxidoreductase YuxK
LKAFRETILIIRPTKWPAQVQPSVARFRAIFAANGGFGMLSAAKTATAVICEYRQPNTPYNWLSWLRIDGYLNARILVSMEKKMATDLAVAPRNEKVEQLVRLPSPSDLPDADVVIFDGACNFCQKSVRRLFQWDGAKRIAFLTIDDPEVSRRWPELSRDDLMEHMHIIDRYGDVHIGAGAFRYLSRRLPRLWPLALLMHIPFSGPFWRAGYRWFARRRYKLSQAVECDNGSCDVHFK